MTLTNGRPMLTTKDIAKKLNITAQTVQEKLRDGQFPGAQKPARGKGWLIPQRSLTTYLESK